MSSRCANTAPAASHNASTPTPQATPITRAWLRSGARLVCSKCQKQRENPPQPQATAARPNAASGAAVCTPSRKTHHPASEAITDGRRVRAATSPWPSHFGPAVNRKPVKNSGMKPKPISSECANPGDTAQGNANAGTSRAASTANHHSALAANTNAAAKKPSRCGAARSQCPRHGTSASACGRAGTAATPTMPSFNAGLRSTLRLMLQRRGGRPARHVRSQQRRPTARQAATPSARARCGSGCRTAAYRRRGRTGPSSRRRAAPPRGGCRCRTAPNR